MQGYGSNIFFKKKIFLSKQPNNKEGTINLPLNYKILTRNHEPSTNKDDDVCVCEGVYLCMCGVFMGVRQYKCIVAYVWKGTALRSWLPALPCDQ